MAPLPVRRARQVDTNDRSAVVIEVDATGEPEALAVLQASLHELPDGHQLVYGYDVAEVGLGAWVGDRRIRLRVWPALVDRDGEITADDPDAAGADLLEVDFDPEADAAALAGLAETGRLLIAGPETGPVPLVLDVDPELVRRLL